MNYDLMIREWNHIYDLCTIDDDTSRGEITRKIMDRCSFLNLTPVGKLLGDTTKTSLSEFTHIDDYLGLCDVSRINLMVCIAVLSPTKWYKDKLNNREKFIPVAWELALKKYSQEDANRLLSLKI